MPADLVYVIQHAHRILSWQENLTEEETPPEWMWELEWELERWFEEVKSKREERFGGSSDGDTTAPMMTNEYAQGRR